MGRDRKRGWCGGRRRDFKRKWQEERKVVLLPKPSEGSDGGSEEREGGSEERVAGEQEPRRGKRKLGEEQERSGERLGDKERRGNEKVETDISS